MVFSCRAWEAREGYFGLHVWPWPECLLVIPTPRRGGTRAASSHAYQSGFLDADSSRR